MPRTMTLWQRTMQYLCERSEAIFLLGDIFDAWVGDDNLEHDAFARDCAQVLRDCSVQRPIYIVVGNRDFLLSQEFAKASGCQLLGDEAVLLWADQRVVLVHGDAQCLSDTHYQQFRAVSRTPQWQAQVLAQSWTARCAMVAQFRAVEGRVHAHGGSAAYHDLTPSAMHALLTQHRAQHLIHGHTHQAQDQRLNAAQAAQPLWRHVLSDWDADCAAPIRGEVLLLDATRVGGAGDIASFQRVDAAACQG